MPIISSFYGISIRMYFARSEHNPPHVHAIYQDSAAVFAISDGQVLDGALPKRASKMVSEWIGNNRDELLAMWASQEFKKLPPLE